MEKTNGTPDVFQLELEAEPPYVATARLFAAAVARHFECEEERVQDIKVAISEACTNAIKAHQEASVKQPIRVIARRLSGALTFDVVDAGPGFDFEPTGQASPPEPSEFFDGGVGLVLIQALFPDVEIGTNPDGGTTVRFAATAPASSATSDRS